MDSIPDSFTFFFLLATDIFGVESFGLLVVVRFWRWLSEKVFGNFLIGLLEFA